MQLLLRLSSQRGFTLIELIIAMMVLSILAIGSVQFIGLSARSYVDTLERSGTSSRASIINEKINRFIHSALPNSLRVTADGSCIESLPILAATTYVAAPIVGNAASSNQVSLVTIDSLLANAGYGVIYPTANNSVLYNNQRNPGRISSEVMSLQSSLNGESIFVFANGASFQFEQPSVKNRFFMVNSPTAICQFGEYIFLYQNYGFIPSINNLQASLPSQLPNRWLLANNIQPSSLTFNVSVSTLKRNGLVSYEYTLQASQVDEAISVNQEVQVKNVP